MLVLIQGKNLTFFKNVYGGGGAGRSRQVREHSTPRHARGPSGGSVISDTLFIIFINDLLELNLNIVASAFADGIAYFYSHQMYKP